MAETTRRAASARSARRVLVPVLLVVVAVLVLAPAPVHGRKRVPRKGGSADDSAGAGSASGAGVRAASKPPLTPPPTPQKDAADKSASTASADAGSEPWPPLGHGHHPAYQRFVQWLSDLGADTTTFQIRKVPGQGFGVYSLGRLRRSQPFARIPRAAIMSTEDVKASELWGYAAEFDVDVNLVGMALMLISEKNKGDASFWAPYIDTLPPTFSTALYFTRTERERLEGSNMSGVLDGLLEYLSHIWTTQWLPVVQAYPERFPPDEYSHEEFMWATSIVFTRCFDFRETDKAPRTRVLAPLIDLINHGNVESVVHFDRPDSQELYVTRPDASIEVGEQIILCYGHKSNRELWLMYGFTLPENKHDNFLVNVHLSNEDDLADIKNKMLDELGVSVGSQEFVLTPEQLPQDLLQVLRISTMDLHDLPVVAERRGDMSQMVTFANEQSVFSILSSALASLIGAIPTTLAQDVEALSSHSLTDFDRNLLHLRIGERRVLQASVNLLNFHFASNAASIPSGVCGPFFNDSELDEAATWLGSVDRITTDETPMPDRVTGSVEPAATPSA